jgi:hypothetical protein
MQTAIATFQKIFEHMLRPRNITGIIQFMKEWWLKKCIKSRYIYVLVICLINVRMICCCVQHVLLRKVSDGFYETT